MLPYGKPTTKGEAQLERLAKRVFLDLWTHVTPWRPKSVDGKLVPVELCDLLIVYRNVILIISEKDYAFPQSGDMTVRWDRWKKKSILKSADQAIGAKRWVLRNPHEVYVDRRLEYPIPNVPIDAEVHLVLLCRNSNSACLEYFSGDTGTFCISADDIELGTPFVVNQRVQGTFVHVFCEASFELITRFIDTPEDFINYLRERNALFQSAASVQVKGEEGLVAHYLKNINAEGQHTLEKIYRMASGNDMIYFDEDDFQTLYFDARFKRRLDADQISYQWDRLLNKFARNLREGTSINPDGVSIGQRESGLRYLAMENRTERRLIMQGLSEWGEMFAERPNSARAILRGQHASGERVAYVFLQVDRDNEISESKYNLYRQRRVSMLFAHMLGVLEKDKSIEVVIGLSFENIFRRYDRISEDIMFASRGAVEAEDWLWFESLCEELGHRPFANGELQEVSTSEYPDK